jgi:hypothetical protein
MPEPNPLRRRLLLTSCALPALAACATALRPLTVPRTTPEAQRLLEASAAAHGLACFADLQDLCVSYSGTWRPIIDRLQPVLVDAGFRGGSEERLLLQQGITAQTHHGPRGVKHVVREVAPGTQGSVRVWFNNVETRETDACAAAALVVDGYGLFLLGPLWLASRAAANPDALRMTPGDRVRLVSGGVRHECDVLRVQLTPGIGYSTTDRLDLFIDVEQHLMRRIRFSLEGLESTRGAVAEVDTFDHVSLHGIAWPTGFYERLRRPFPLPVHDWRLTGLDVNRGLQAQELRGPTCTGLATAPAGGPQGYSASP